MGWIHQQNVAGSVYLSYFRIREDPFSLTPDPRFLFLSQRHREALAHLLYGMGERGGFVQLTGEVGTGKTTLCRSLLEQAPGEVEIALILNPKLTAVELVASVCDELHVPYPRGTQSIKVLVDLLNRHLLDTHSEGRRTVLIVDEAQNLSPEVLEQLRLLTNLETTTHRLLQILLIGQPELQSVMSRPELRQLAQRVTARYHLTPLSGAETAAYIRHRLEVAGAGRAPFTPRAVVLVHRLSGGIPRLINVICDRALLGAYAEQRERVGRRLVRRAADEVMGRCTRSGYRRAAVWGVGLLGAVLLGGAVWSFRPSLLPSEWWGSRSHVAMVPVEETSTEPQQAPEKEPAVAAETLPDPASGPPETGVPPQVAEEPAAVPGPPRADLGALLAAGELKTDAESAFATLFEYWDVDYGELQGALACDRAEEAGLRCLHGRGNWTSLRHYDVPAILTLTEDSGREDHVVLSELTEDESTLDFAGTKVRVPNEQVEPHWFGGFILLWRPPKLHTSFLSVGANGADVLWLRVQLDRAEGAGAEEGSDSPSPRFDSELKERVIRFQRAHALRPDGVVGEQTLIRLMSDVDPDVPRLQRPGP